MINILRLRSLKKFYPEVEKRGRPSDDLNGLINNGIGGYGGVGGRDEGMFIPPTRGGRGPLRGRDGSHGGRGVNRADMHPYQTIAAPVLDYSNMSLEQQRLMFQMTRQREELQRRQRLLQMKNLHQKLPLAGIDGPGIPQLPPIPRLSPPTQGQQFSVDPFRLYSKVSYCCIL